MLHCFFRTTLTVVLASTLLSCRSGPEWFDDAAEMNELEFTSYSGDHLWYLIDTMGSGLAAGDYDGDGDADLFLASGHAILDEYQEEAAEYPDALWRNDGGGRFTDVTREAGVGAVGWSNGAVFCDFDGDGDLDLHVTRHGPNLLYRNRGDGTFEEIGAKAGVACPAFSAAASFADLDGDGDLDLYVTNYAEYDLVDQKGKVQWFSDGVMQFPQHFPQTDNVLYMNQGDGTFRDATREAGAAGHGRGLGILATDVDDDGDVDLFVANDVGLNNLLVNDGTGRFTEEGLIFGVDRNADGAFEASMGVAGGDIDRDGDIDLIVTNYGGEQNTLYRNEGDGLFLDVSRELGVVNQTVLDCVGWGVGFHDLDLDGWLDLLVVNGHVVPDYVGWYLANFNDAEGDIPQMRSEAYRADAEQTKLLFLGGPEGFRDVTGEAGDAIEDERMSRGAAFADFDEDGRIDVAVSNKNDLAQVLLNRIPTTGHWLRLALRAPAPNTRGVGARVTVRAGALTLVRELHCGTSYLSGDEDVLHFGLGAVDRIDSIEVRWPDGSVEVLPGLAVDRKHTIRKKAA